MSLIKPTLPPLTPSGRKRKAKAKGKAHSESDAQLPICGVGKRKDWQATIVEHNCGSCIRVLKAREAKRLKAEQVGQLELEIA